MSFDKIEKEILSYNIEKLKLIASKDEYYYNLLDAIIELYQEWDEEISFTEIRDKCIDKFDKITDWSKTDWNQQTFRRLFIGTKLNHFNDKKKDDEVMYYPTQEGIDFQLERLHAITIKEDWAKGEVQSNRFLDKQNKNKSNSLISEDTGVANRNFLRKFVSESALKKRGEHSSIVSEVKSEPDYPSIAEPAQEILFNESNELIIKNDLLEDRDIDEGLVDFYDHITFNLTECQIDKLILTKFTENKDNPNQDNDVFFQIYKSASNIYDSSAITVSSGHFNIKDIGKNILEVNLTSGLKRNGTNYSMLIYKRPKTVNGPLFYQLEATTTHEVALDEKKENNFPSRLDLLDKINDLNKMINKLSDKVGNQNNHKVKELKIPKQAIETEESMDLLSKLLVDDSAKETSIKRKIMAIDGSNVMRIRGTKAIFSRLQIAVKYCLDEKYDKIYIICDANLRYKLNDEDRGLYEQMLKGESDKVHVQQSPGGTIADLFILNMANNFHKEGHAVKVMTNDLFRDFTKQDGNNYNSEISKLIKEKHLLLKFMFIADPNGKERFFENK